ncbi:MAG: hypothetical protein ACRD5H_11360 [Nitrososphaerales archaeon]
MGGMMTTHFQPSTETEQKDTMLTMRVTGVLQAEKMFAEFELLSGWDHFLSIAYYV